MQDLPRAKENERKGNTNMTTHIIRANKKQVCLKINKKDLESILLKDVVEIKRLKKIISNLVSKIQILESRVPSYLREPNFNR